MKRKTGISFWFLLLLLAGCGGNSSTQNPFKNIQYPTPKSNEAEIGKTSLAGLHENIFSPSCAIPGCHDGHFEPDFRSVQSAYRTLVWHPIIKNNEEKDFSYRVIPFKPEESVLFERVNNCCFVNQDDRMPQDEIGVPLPDEQIEAIRVWIADGAPDLYGKTREHPFDPQKGGLAKDD